MAMRRGKFEVRVKFAPTRFAHAHLVTAYEVVTPVAARTIERGDAEQAEQQAASAPSVPAKRAR